LSFNLDSTAISLASINVLPSFPVSFINQTTGNTAIGYGSLYPMFTGLRMSIFLYSNPGNNHYNTGDNYVIIFPNTITFYY
jgi:hypothetical protein